MSKYSKAYFNPYSDSFSCRVAIVSPEVLQEAEQRLAEFPGGMESAMKRAMARATAYLRTQSTREIRKNMTFPEKLFAQSRTSRLAIAISTALKQNLVSWQQNPPIPLWRRISEPANRQSRKDRHGNH